MPLLSKSCTASITSLATLPTSPAPTLLAGSATQLIARSLSPTSPVQRGNGPDTRWNVLRRERVHHIVVKGTNLLAESGWDVLVAGGKEAALLRIESCEAPQTSQNVTLKILQRFQLDDWILACSFLRDDGFLFITSHNSLQLFRTSSSTLTESPSLVQIVHAPLRPLLWSANFSKSTYTSLEEVRIAAGSILGDVLTWDTKGIDETAAGSETEVVTLELARMKKFVGHQGAVFTVTFSPSGDHLLTGSEDRTIRAWDAFGQDGSGPIDTLWGHLGRIWRVGWIEEGMVMSVAEDASARVWSVDLKNKSHCCLHTFTNGHDGRSLWAVASCQIGKGGPTVVLSGGADGGVRCWPVVENLDGLGSREKELDFGRIGPIKAVAALNSSTNECLGVLLAKNGSIYSTSLPPTSPPELLHTDSAAASIYLADSSSGPLLWIFSSNHICTLICLSSHSSQIWSIRAPTYFLASPLKPSQFLIFEQIDHTVQLWSFSADQSTPSRCLSTLSKAGLNDPSTDLTRPIKITSAAFLDDELVLLGTRYGELLLVHMREGGEGEVLERRRVHLDTVNDLRFGTEGNGWEVESVSRDGSRRVHRLVREEHGWNLTTLGERMIVKGVVERILGGGRYLALVKTSAVIVDAEGNKLETFKAPGLKLTGVFVEDSNGSHHYRLVQGKVIHQSSPPSSRSFPSPVPIKGHHGREIRSAAFHHDEPSGLTLLATGAENAILTISLVSDPDRLVTPIFTDASVTTSIKTVSFTRTEKGLFLIASGAQQLIQAWKVDVLAETREVRVLPWGLAEVDGDAETRVLDHQVATVDEDKGLHVVIAGFSDGRIKMLRFDDQNKTFERVAESEGKGKCVLTVKVKEIEGKRFLFTGRSDGLLSIWDITQSVEAAREASPIFPLDAPLLSFHAHQSGINGLDVAYNPDTRMTDVATGGDDNAVHVHRIRIDGDAKLSHRTELLFSILSAHASTIQGLCFLSPSRLASSAVDQRLNIYSLASDALSFEEGLCLGVSDCSAMDVRALGKEEGQWEIALVGIGVEIVGYAPEVTK